MRGSFLREYSPFMLLTLGFAVVFGWLHVTKDAEPPPKPRLAFEMPREPAPVHIARVESVCEPTILNEERQRLIERCSRDGGRTSEGWTYLSCWQGDPYGTRQLWKVEAKDYPEEVLHAKLPRWYTRQRIDELARENRQLRLAVP